MYRSYLICKPRKNFNKKTKGLEKNKFCTNLRFNVLENIATIARLLKQYWLKNKKNKMIFILTIYALIKIIKERGNWEISHIISKVSFN